jgi:hypothetical protein
MHGAPQRHHGEGDDTDQGQVDRHGNAGRIARPCAGGELQRRNLMHGRGAAPASSGALQDPGRFTLMSDFD